MKSLHYTLLCLALAAPATAIARTTNAGVDEITFQWENAMALAAADPCASYLAPRYNPGSHEANYDDYGNDLRF